MMKKPQNIRDVASVVSLVMTVLLCSLYVWRQNWSAAAMSVCCMIWWANDFINSERIAVREAQLDLYRAWYARTKEGFSDVLVTEVTEKKEGRTYLEDFMGKHPNVPMDSDDLPISCVEDIYGHSAVDEELCSRCRCADCWNRKMKTEGEEDGQRNELE